jgi:hypothetical protein
VLDFQLEVVTLASWLQALHPGQRETYEWAQCEHLQLMTKAQKVAGQTHDTFLLPPGSALPIQTGKIHSQRPLAG